MNTLIPQLKLDESSPRYHRTKSKGDFAEMAAAIYFLDAGFAIYKPFSENCPCDWLVDDGHRLAKIQVKWVRVADGVLYLRTSTIANGKERAYRPHEVDFFAGYAGDIGKLYLLPREAVGTCTKLQLRLREARNGQKAGIRWADDYEFSGLLPWPDVAVNQRLL